MLDQDKCYPDVLFEAQFGMALMKPKMFIGSSLEKIDLAYAAQEGLEHHVEATVWS
jgi:hypothetical protein